MWAAGRLRGLADRLDPPGPQTVHDEINLSPEAADALYRVAERYNGRVKACAENPYAVGLPEFGNESSPAPYIGARAQRLSRP